MREQSDEEVARAFVDNVILIYGVPQVILSGCRTQFLSEIFKGICRLLGIKRIQTTSWHPQSNGSNERTHKELIEYIRNYVSSDLHNWDHWVKYDTFVHNTSPHRATSYMPFQLLFGRAPDPPGVLQKEPLNEFYAYDNYAKELEASLRSSYALARRNLETVKLDNKKNYDQHVLK
jgi:hypothetical protein